MLSWKVFLIKELLMTSNKGWTRLELLIAFGLYCQLPFGKLHSRNPEIIKYAEKIGRTPSALAMKLTNIASLDPAITSTGRKGLSGASSADRTMWKEMQNDWESFALESETAIASITQGEESLAMIESEDVESKNYSGMDKEIKSKARIGQSFFRRSVLSAYNYSCCITGLSIPKLLVASHIVPWRSDPTNRLNPRNGLSLSMLHDKAFDLGIITINDDMTLRVSDFQVTDDDHFFQIALKSYENKPISLPEKFSPHKEFLSYHREMIFQG
jgi:predicted restriction endonuclease